MSTKSTKKKTAPATVSIISMAEIEKLDRKATVALVVEQSTIARRAYVATAKAIIRLTKLLEGTKDTLFGVLGKAGVSVSNIKNGQQLARVWASLVVPGHMSEGQFNELLFLDAVAINKIIREHGVAKLKPILGDLEEVSHFAEHGVTRAEKQKAEEAKKAASAPVTPATKATAGNAAHGKVTASASVSSDKSAVKDNASSPEPTATPSAPVVTAMPRDPLVEFGKLCDMLMKAGEELARTADETIITKAMERLASVGRALQEAAEAAGKGALASAA
ncbi:MAG: hypothetical protein LBK99_16525 [Opitutaceae bacterium]|jgi:hypothetical protein|nr:hypothetical protein [Opitutaceae bacterium]